MTLELIDIEKTVLQEFLTQFQLESDFYGNDFSNIFVTDRIYSGAGFMTKTTSSRKFNDIKLKNIRWSKLVGMVNDVTLVGFVIYVDEGYLSAIEGYTLEESWPEKITKFILIDAN